VITQTERGLSQPTREAEQQLERRLEQFDSWAASEVYTDDDWEANFPDWSGLILEAETVTARGAQSRRGLVLLSRCWAFLALTCHLGSIDPQPYVKQMLSDLDSYNRYVAVSRYDPQFIPAALQDQIQAVAQDPEVARLLAGDGQ